MLKTEMQPELATLWALPEQHCSSDDVAAPLPKQHTDGHDGWSKPRSGAQLMLEMSLAHVLAVLPL